MFPIPAPITILLSMLAATLLCTPLFMWGARISALQAGWRWHGWRTLVQGLGWGVLLAVLGVGWLRILLLTGNYLPIPVSPTPAEWVLLAVVTPVVEEVFFRGVVFGVLQRSWRPYWAVILSSLVYLGAHADDQWLAFVFLTGVGYALAFRCADSVYAAMLAHVLVIVALLTARIFPAAVVTLHGTALAGTAIIALIIILTVRRIPPTAALPDEE